MLGYDIEQTDQVILKLVFTKDIKEVFTKIRFLPTAWFGLHLII